MRPPIVFLAALLLWGTQAAPAAEREADVLVVRFPGGGGEERFRNMDLPAAARYGYPVPFTVRAGRTELRADFSAGLVERERIVLASRPGGTLERVGLLLSGAPDGEPRPSRTVTISFTLDELLVRGGAWSAIPAAWACFTAASQSGWTEGRVWARSVAYDGRTGRITVRVGLSK